MLQPGDEPDPDHAAECVRKALDGGLDPRASVNEYDRWLQHQPFEERIEFYCGETISKHFMWNKLKFEAGVPFSDLNMSRPENILKLARFDGDEDTEETDA